MTTIDVASLLEDHARRIAPLERASREASWNLARTSETHWEQESARLAAEIRRELSNRETYRLLSGLRDTARPADADLDRQLELVWRDHATNQADPALLEELAGLEARAESTYSSFRPLLDGKPATENEVRKILRESGDPALRRRAWEASKSLGPTVAPLVSAMVRCRNRIANDAGHRDFFTMDLARQEMDEAFLFDVLGRLEELTAAPHAALLRELFGRIAKRFRIAPEDVRPWHVADPFFQESVPPADLDLRPFFAPHDPADVSREALARMGFDVGAILARSDLYPRERKNQHAFCTHVDRTTRDVRILCNLESDEHWMDTMLHELGHGVYDEGLADDLPWRLREPAHTLTTEAIALLFGRLATNPDWMIRVLGADSAQVDELRRPLREHARTRQLLFPRWVMVMTRFERTLYGVPAADLDRSWWDLVEKYQGVHRPDSRHEPDWACKVHMALAPVYYHNYLLGDLAASQIDAWLTAKLGTPFWFERKETARLLHEGLFRDGARRRWNETLRRATGSVLDPGPYMDQFVRERT